MSGSGRPVRLCDYSRIRGEALELCLKMQDKIQAGQCRLVDLLEPRKGEKRRDPAKSVKLVKRGAGGIWRTQNYVGIFQLGNERVVITSRFDQKNKPFFLYYLLETCWDAALLTQESLGGAYDRDMFDVLLVAKLAIQIQKAWKKGTLRQYRTFERNDSRVRGPIDVPRHIRENLGQDNGRIAYRTRAHSLDNPYNVLLLQAVDTAARQHPALLNRLCRRLPEFQAALRILRQEAPDWVKVRREAVLRHTAKKIINPVYRDYEPARIAARAVLQRLGADPQGKSQRGSVVTGVFLDMDRLWEDFLEKELFSGAQAAAQEPNRILDGHLNVRPDFLWKEKGVVLDAKNRPVWSETLSPRPEMRKKGTGLRKKNVQREERGVWKKKLWEKRIGLWEKNVRKKVQDDVYQVLSYMLALDCQDGGVVFPDRQHGPQTPQLSPVGGRRFWRIPVYIPQADSYTDFANLMKEETKRLKRTKRAEVVRPVSE